MNFESFLHVFEFQNRARFIYFSKGAFSETCLQDFNIIPLEVCPFKYRIIQKMSSVYLLIYSFKFLKLFWLDHTEIRVFDRDLAYGIDGITISPSENRPDMRLKRIIHCGLTTTEELDLTQWLINTNQFFTKAKYRLFWNNCRDFSRAILIFLDPNDREEGK